MPTTAFEYVHADHLGSTAASTDATGASLLSLAHDPYGTRREADWSAQLADADVLGIGAGQDDGRTRRGFTGHEQLARTGLVHMGARLYDPRIGRFLSPDPVVSEPSSGQAWNLYSYVGNSPTSYVDPTGMFRAGAGCGTVYLCQNDGGGAGGGFTDETLTRTTAHVTSVIVWRPVYASYSFPGWGLSGIGGDRDYGRRLRGFRGGPRVATRRAFVGTPFTRLETRTQDFISARDSSPADSPMVGLVDTVRGWWLNRLHGKYVRMRAECERVHGPGGCDGTSVKELTDVFGQATATLGAASIGGSVQRAAGGIPRALSTKAAEVRVVIGRVEDLRNLPSNERSLLGRLPKPGESESKLEAECWRLATRDEERPTDSRCVAERRPGLFPECRTRSFGASWLGVRPADQLVDPANSLSEA